MALIAETSSGFVEAFFACQYAGLVAVPLAIPMGVGQRDSGAPNSGVYWQVASPQPLSLVMSGCHWSMPRRITTPNYMF